ncbi:hypothetical protein CK203_042858 [Vitis vinifera]|uniref:MULE transposase domain-containing protein n=1 Tax=Vitis vinifera TaxID=29760 RepID=A0A438HUN6_VITVI|nr:hypothetical protein CK203_042858 [Vitis vinifera]
MNEIELYIEQVSVQPWVRGQLLGNFTQLLLGQNDNVKEFEYGCGPSSVPVAMTYECREDENEEECESQEGEDQSERAEDVQHDGDEVFKFIDEENNNVNVVSSFLALHEAMESEQGRYVFLDKEGCDMSNNPDPEDLIEFSPVQYHLAPSLQFENVENIGTTSFAINKYNGPHKCVNPCLNRDHQQLDSNLIAAHIQGMIKTQFTLSVVAIQAKGENIDSWELFWACIRTRVTHRRELCVISYRHPGIMAAMSNVHLGWSKPYAYHMVCMRHLASSFMTRFKDKILKNLMCRAVLATKIEKFNKHMNTIGRINTVAQQWLEAIPFKKWALSHDRGRSYFVVRRKQGANRLASNEEYTPYVNAKIKANVVKAGSHEMFYMITSKDNSM